MQIRLNKLLTYSILFCLISFAAPAQTFDFNSDCISAYRTIATLELDSGAIALHRERMLHPANLIPIYLENYIDFLRCFVSDDQATYLSLKANKDKRISLIQMGDQHSPWYLYTQAEINIQWAALDIKNGEYVKTVWEIKKALKQLKENQAKYPDFIPNKKSLGMLEALLGAVPDQYKWALSLLGMSADMRMGVQYLDDVKQYGQTNPYIFKKESTILYALIMQHLLNRNDDAWRLLAASSFPDTTDIISVFAYMHVALYSKHIDELLRVHHQIRDFNQFADRFPMLHYLLGQAYLYKTDAQCAATFYHFLIVNRSMNYIKATYQKIAWTHALRHDTAGYFRIITLVKTRGQAVIDADKQAAKEASLGLFPNSTLLHARVLFDGGYYDKAATMLAAHSIADFNSTDDKAEYYYRLGRICQELGKNNDAIQSYLRAMDIGKAIPRSFAPNSAYQLGNIYLSKGDKITARKYYEWCLAFGDHEYKNSLDQKAKAALSQMK